MFDLTTSLRPDVHVSPGTGLGPRALQGVRLLAMNQEAVTEFLTRAAERNPVLSVRLPAPELEIAAAGTGLYDVLGKQIRMTFEPRDAAIAWSLVERLDESGYLRMSVPHLAAELCIDSDRLRPVLAKLRRFEPYGIASEDLGACFERQLEARDTLTPVMRAFLANLDAFADGRRAEVARVCGVPLQDLPALARQLQRLDPHPAQALDAVPVAMRRPDIRVVETTAGLRVELVPEAWPSVSIDDAYGVGLRGAEAWLSGQRDKARALRRNLERRASTILRVGQSIVDRQAEFLRTVSPDVAPLSQADVAARTGLHAGTVSRAVRGRTLECARGLVPLAGLFARPAPGDAALSTDRVKAALRTLIISETATSVRSDAALARVLCRDFGPIARRTVAKYRAQLGLPGAVRRRAHLPAEVVPP